MRQPARVQRSDDLPSAEMDYVQILWGVLRRRKKVVIAALAIVALPLLGGTYYLQRPRYLSRAIVQIKPSIADLFPGTRDLPGGAC